GTRMMATHESPLHPSFKQAIVRSDGHDTLLTEIPDLASGRVWPGAMSRALRNAFIERWAGREWALRRDQRAAAQAVLEARRSGDADNAPLFIGQDAGLIDSVKSAGEIVESMVAEAEEIIKGRLGKLVRAR
ncbi:MAG TPA: nitronate monooxygenase, partial [Candidatus Binatia bacterium]